MYDLLDSRFSAMHRGDEIDPVHGPTHVYVGKVRRDIVVCVEHGQGFFRIARLKYGCAGVPGDVSYADANKQFVIDNQD